MIQFRLTKPLSILCCMALIGVSLNMTPVYAQTTFHQEAALDYMQSQQWDFASYEWRKILESEPKNVQAHLGLAQSLMASNYVREAIQHLENTLAHLSDPQLEVQLAKAYLRLKKTPVAAEIYRKILQNDPYHSVAFKGLLQLHKALPSSQREETATFLSQIAESSREKGKAAFQSGQYKKAAQYYEITTAYYKKLGPINDYGLALLLSGQHTASANMFHHIRNKTSMWQLHANAALAYLSIDKAYQARVEVKKAIAAAPDNQAKAKLYNILGYIYEHSHKNTTARYAYEKALKLDPNFTKARRNLAYVLQKNRDYKASVKVYRDLINRDPENITLLNQLGFVYELMHEPKKARDMYQKAIRVAPKNKDAYYNLAMLYKKMNETRKANTALRELMNLEFSTLEQTASKPQKEQLSLYHHKLFEYVDIFFAEQAV